MPEAKISASTITRLDDFDMFKRLFTLLSEIGPLLPDHIIDGGSEYLALRTHLFERLTGPRYLLNEHQLSYLASRYNKDKK